MSALAGQARPLQPTVFIIDQDHEHCEYLSQLLTREALAPQCFHSAQAFLKAYTIYHQGCVVLELNLPDKCGLALQQEICRFKYALPLIFVTSCCEIPKVVKAMQQGASHYFSKPVNELELVQTLRLALEQDKERRQQRLEAMMIQARVANLTRRERQVFDLVVQHKSNKEMMEYLGIQLKTVEFHRARMMEKMHASSVVEVIEMARRCL